MSDGTVGPPGDLPGTAPASAPPGLAGAVMRRVAPDLRPARRLPVPGPDPTVSAFVTDTALAKGIRLALDPDPAVVVRRCRLEPGDSADEVRVWLSVAISYDLFAVGQDLRGRVGRAVHDLVGLPVHSVDVDIVDVYSGSHPDVKA